MAERKECLENHHPYTTPLGELGPGVLFSMVNYLGVYMRVEAGEHYFMGNTMAFEPSPKPFDDDGEHVPIVELATGHLSYMSKVKPCFIYGEKKLRR